MGSSNTMHFNTAVIFMIYFCNFWLGVLIPLILVYDLGTINSQRSSQIQNIIRISSCVFLGDCQHFLRSSLNLFTTFRILLTSRLTPAVGNFFGGGNQVKKINIVLCEGKHPGTLPNFSSEVWSRRHWFRAMEHIENIFFQQSTQRSDMFVWNYYKTLQQQIFVVMIIFSILFFNWS